MINKGVLWLLVLKQVCQICKKEFNVYPSYISRGDGIYCSRKCKDKAQSLRMLNESPEKTPHWKGGLIKKVCLNCLKEIQVKRCFTNKPSFCSKSCANSYNSKRRPKTGKTLKCKVCCKEFYRNPSAINRETKKPQFCSQKCRAIDNIKNQKTDDTNIERIIENWLKENKVEYVKQQDVEGIALVDFFVSPNKCLFCDGDFWHLTSERIVIDNEQRTMLKARGYEVHSLLGSKILNGERFCEIIGIKLDPEYFKIARARVNGHNTLF